MMAMMEAGAGGEAEAKPAAAAGEANDATENGEQPAGDDKKPEKLVLPAPVGKGSGALILAAMRSAEALSVDSATQDATMEALAAPLARALALPEGVFKQWWCGGAAAKFVHGDDSDIAAAAAAAAADAGVQDGGGNAGVPVLTQVTVNADPGCRIPHPVREALAKTGAMRVAERALLLHHLLGNLHIHDARTATSSTAASSSGSWWRSSAGPAATRRTPGTTAVASAPRSGTSALFTSTWARTCRPGRSPRTTCRSCRRSSTSGGVTCRAAAARRLRRLPRLPARLRLRRRRQSPRTTPTTFPSPPSRDACFKCYI